MVRWLKLPLATIPALFVAVTLLLQLPREFKTAEILVSELQLPTRHEAKDKPDDHRLARLLCESLTNQPLGQIDCRTGMQVGHSTPSGPLHIQNPQAYAKLMDRLSNDVQFYQEISRQLDPTSPSATTSVFRYRVNFQIDHYRTFMSIATKSELTPDKYKQQFNDLLALEGMRYSSLTGKFTPSSWHLARIYDNGAKLQQRGANNKWLLQAAWWVFIPVIFLTNLFLIKHFSLSGGITGILFSGVSALSVIIAANASLRFGGDSSVYIFSPLADQFQRQMGIVIGLHLFLMLIVLATRWISGFSADWERRIQSGTLLVLPASLLGYLTLGHAAGSELLKIGISIMAATAVTLYARETFLVARYAGDIDANGRLIIDQRAASVKSIATKAFLRKRLWVFVGLTVMFSLLCLGISSLAFSDFGGTLVATSILISMILMIYGKAIGGAAIIGIFMGGLGALFTDKVQSRIKLMLEPMRAKVSDFARLLEFQASGQPDGHGIQDLPWCNLEGVCVPIQILSDYMPTLLSAMFGNFVAHSIFVMSALCCILVGVESLRRMISGAGFMKLLAGVAFFLALGSLVQIVLTFLGNWHLIPLTGLGAPFFSIGLSSSLAPTLAVALWLVSTKKSQ
jgi:hypothetical protein